MPLSSPSRQSPRPSSAPRALGRAGRLKLVIACAVLAFIAAACGGNSETDLDELIAAAGGDESGGRSIDVGNLQIDADEDADRIAVSGGGVDTAFGEDVRRPDWLELWVQLPDGLALNMAINDSNTGERILQGLVEGGDEEAILAQQTAMLEAAGYEALQEASSSTA